MTVQVKTQPYKAVGAFALTFLGALLASVSGKTNFNDLTPFQWFVVVGSALVTSGAVWGISNPPKKVQ